MAVSLLFCFVLFFIAIIVTRLLVFKATVYLSDKRMGLGQDKKCHKVCSSYQD